MTTPKSLPSKSRHSVKMMPRSTLDEVRETLTDLETIVDDIAYAVQARANGAQRPAAEDIFAMCVRAAERVQSGVAALHELGHGGIAPPAPKRRGART